MSVSERLIVYIFTIYIYKTHGPVKYKKTFKYKRLFIVYEIIYGMQHNHDNNDEVVRVF